MTAPPVPSPRIVQRLASRALHALRQRSAVLLALALVTLAAPLPAAPGDTTLVLTGVITRADHQSYRTVAFTVPHGVHAISVDFSHSGRDEHAVIDLGVMDPDGVRGWSGGNKAHIVIGEASATPSYRPGPIQAGPWRLLLGIPNIRAETQATYEARITFYRTMEPPFAAAPLNDAPGWYRGDLHLHTGHSDGTCDNESGARIPCPVFRTLDVARERGIDFVAVTDHNTVSQFNELRALQPAYENLLLIGGRELTTFQGHANILAASQPIDFRVGAGRTMAAALRDARPGFVIINHPSVPSGEPCMGCGWTAPSAAARYADAVEVVNGGAADALTKSAEGPLSGQAFWHARLNEGRRLVGVAGSDNHDPDIAATRFSSIGKPLTVVGAANLSQAAILAGLRAGHVFIDVEGTRTRFMAMQARSAECHADMGGVLACTDADIDLVVEVDGVPNASIELYFDGEKATPRTPISLAREDGEQLTATFRYPLIGPSRHWARADVRDAEGRLVLIGNPIYINWR